MQSDFCVVLAPAVLAAGGILLICLLLLLVGLAVSSSSSSPNLEATRDEIRRIRIQAHSDIHDTAKTYQKQAEEIFTRKR